MRITNKKYICEKLAWDTQHFGVESAKITLKEEISYSDLLYLSDVLHGYKFIVVTNMNNNAANNYLIGRSINAFLVDVNIQFEKRVVSQQRAIDTNTIIRNNMESNEKIKQIAVRSFVYSRFFNDPHLSKEEAYKVYENWVINSFNNESKYIAYYSSNDDIMGFILFSYIPDILQVVIELITVSEEYSGQGIGKKMMASFENYIMKMGYQTIKVGTQVDNLLAQNFYSSTGFRHKQCNSVYHWWNQ